MKSLQINKLYKKYYAENNVRKTEQCIEIGFLMSKSGIPHAIRLQLNNLVLSYGYEVVRKELDKLNIGINKAG